MSLDELWEELGARAPAERDGRMIQRVHPDSDVDLFVTLELQGPRGQARRAMELQVDDGAIVDAAIPSGTRHVALLCEPRGTGRTGLILRLEEPGAGGLFAAMCEDVARTAAAQPDDERAVSAWIGRFIKWHRMLSGGQQGLSPRRQRGLFAELLAIRDQLSPLVGINETILAWRGPDGAPRDFEVDGCAVEVKSSAANEPQVVLVHGERQLDDTGLAALVLVHQSLEVLRDAGETLPGIILELRALARGEAEAGTLEDRLLQSGYSDFHEPLYRRTGYAIRRTSFFRVGAGFPRITESELVDGVGAVRYSLAIEACRDHEVPESILAQCLTPAPHE